MIRVAAAQYPISRPSGFPDWKQHTQKWVADASGHGADLLLFPEYGAMELVGILDEATRNDLRAQVLAMNALKDEFCETFARLSAQYGVIIVAPSLPVIHNDKAVNRVYVFSPGGATGYQDKHFMTRFEDEEWKVSGGENILSVFETSWGCFGIQICYDVEFPLASALLAGAGAGLILAPSCTETIRGATRVHVGARARALENQLYTAVAQTTGNADWSPAVDVNYGYAAIYSTPDRGLPEEGILASGTPQATGWIYGDLDMKLLAAVRQDGQVFNFRDSQRVMEKLKERGPEIRKILLDS
ncbi:carbon-nitrogen hydrolase family protein [Ravibacter arvi]|uniref:Carbon-nitrogen hydrolase family protein n=1 Tax=Ravibacter arvi TaxID=2051041 RepID=A0ABP8M0W3_9BACT